MASKLTWICHASVVRTVQVSLQYRSAYSTGQPTEQSAYNTGQPIQQSAYSTGQPTEQSAYSTGQPIEQSAYRPSNVTLYRSKG